MQGEGCTGDLACGGIDGNSFKHTSTPPDIHSAAVGSSISRPFSSSGVRAGVTATSLSHLSPQLFFLPDLRSYTIFSPDLSVKSFKDIC